MRHGLVSSFLDKPQSKQGCLRVDFDRRLKLEFHGSKGHY